MLAQYAGTPQQREGRRPVEYRIHGTAMKRPKILALILAGGAGGRLGVLTEHRAKPALPFAGTLRLIDFSLSNCLHSGLTDVWVIEQYQLHTLNDHLANGRPWDLDRTYGGLQVLPPSVEGADEDGDGDSEEAGKERQGGLAEGNADAIYRQRKLLREFAPDLVVVLSADHVYKLDYRDVVDLHRERGAEVTMVTTRVPPGDDASRFGVVQTDADGRVTDFDYKPKKPRGDQITAEVFVYDTKVLLATLDEIVEDGSELKDYGDELLPRLVKRGKAWAFPLDGYWRDVGTVESYWQAHADLLASDNKLGLDHPDWPILTYGPQHLPAHLKSGAAPTDSLISPGCVVSGKVTDSVLSPGVIIEEGAEVVGSILLHDARIKAGARVTRTVVDEQAEVGAQAIVGGPDGEFTVVGKGARVPADGRLAPGKKLSPA